MLTIRRLLKTFTSGTQDFPGRASSMNLWFGQSQKMCGHLNATILALNHETGNPQTHYVSYYGGGPVGYDFKYSFQLRHWHRKLADLPRGCKCLNPETENTAERALISHRFPARPDRGASVLLKLDSKGFTCYPLASTHTASAKPFRAHTKASHRAPFLLLVTRRIHSAYYGILL